MPILHLVKFVKVVQVQVVETVPRVLSHDNTFTNLSEGLQLIGFFLQRHCWYDEDDGHLA